LENPIKVWWAKKYNYHPEIVEDIQYPVHTIHPSRPDKIKKWEKQNEDDELSRGDIHIHYNMFDVIISAVFKDQPGEKREKRDSRKGEKRKIPGGMACEFVDFGQSYT
jgi:hypothetical protein